MNKKKNLVVLDIDDTLTKSEKKHTDSLLFAMEHFGITKVDTDWRNYTNATDSYIFSANYEKTHKQHFDFKHIEEFENVMTNKFLTYPDTTELNGASQAVQHILQNTDYGVCFATGSIAKPAFLKLEQASILRIPEVTETSNCLFTREEIVKSAIAKAKTYYKVDKFDHIISFGDALWDAITANNLNIHFVGVNHKNMADFQKMNVKHHIHNWLNFDIRQIENKLNIT